MVTKAQVRLATAIKLTFVSNLISINQSISGTDAMRQFMQSKTYEVLSNPTSALWERSAEYIYFMYTQELDGDWEGWAQD